MLVTSHTDNEEWLPEYSKYVLLNKLQKHEFFASIFIAA